jgi:hypothetical protein
VGLGSLGVCGALLGSVALVEQLVKLGRASCPVEGLWGSVGTPCVGGACEVGLFVDGLQWGVGSERLGVMGVQLGTIYVEYEAVWVLLHSP